MPNTVTKAKPTFQKHRIKEGLKKMLACNYDGKVPAQVSLPAARECVRRVFQKVEHRKSMIAQANPVKACNVMSLMSAMCN